MDPNSFDLVSPFLGADVSILRRIDHSASLVARTTLVKPIRRITEQRIPSYSPDGIDNATGAALRSQVTL